MGKAVSKGGKLGVCGRSQANVSALSDEAKWALGCVNLVCRTEVLGGDIHLELSANQWFLQPWG